MKPTAEEAAAALAVTLEKSSRLAIVDRFVALDTELSQLKLYKPKIDSHEALRKIIQSWPSVDKVPAAESKTYAGETHAVILGPSKKERKITNRPKLRRLLTLLKVFESLWKIDLGDIDKHTSEEQRREFLSVGLTGPRKVEAVANPQSKAAV